MFTAEIIGIDSLERSWRHAVGVVRLGATLAVRRAVSEGAKEARANHTFKNRTRTLEKSIEGFTTGWRGDWYEGVIRAGARYASFVDAGTSPHMIVGNPFLTFVWKGVKVSFRYVNHPGSRPYPFMHLAYFKAERVLFREMELGLARAQEWFAAQRSAA